MLASIHQKKQEENAQAMFEKAQEMLSVHETKADGMSTGLFQDEEDGYNLEEETKYKIKLDAPKSEPALPASDDEGLDSFEDAGDDLGFGDESGDGNDKPFDDEPFDAGVEADEDEDPEKFIQQLAGKLGTSLRKYNDERGEPDFDLEKYAINSVISASHTSEMDEEDQKDIIRKIKTSGAESDVDSSDDSLGIDDEEATEEPAKDGGDEFEFEDLNGGEGLEESVGGMDNDYDFSQEKRIIEVIKRLRDTGMELTVDNVIVGSLFSPGGTIDDENLVKAVLDVYSSHVEESMIGKSMAASEIPSDEYMTDDELLASAGMQVDPYEDPRIKGSAIGKSMAASEMTEEENPCWDGYEMVGMKMKDGKEVPNCVPKQNENEETGEFGSNNYMFWQNLSTIKKSIDDLMSMDKSKVDALLDNGHGWALDHMATSADDVEEVYHFIDARYSGNEDEYYGSVESINEAEYKGKEVKLNKPMRGDVKKYKVYVKNDKGNVVKVNFGDKNMEIKRDDPERRKSFRARHKCDNPGPKWKARYWSCKFWSTKSVSDLLGEGLQDSEKNGKFVETTSMKDTIVAKLHEMKESVAPAPVKPKVDPKVKPSPKRKKIWETKPVVKPNPKMDLDNDETNENV